MVSKRNSRVYNDEGKHCQQGQQQQRSATTNGREYNSIPREEIKKIAIAMEEEFRNVIVSRDASGMALPYALSPGHGCPQATALGNSSTLPFSENKTALAVHAGQYPSIPTEGHPINFGVVIPGVYRSSYPRSPDYGFLQRLQLKTVVTLVKKDERDHQFETFAETNGVRQVIFDMKGTKKETIPLDTMASILRLVLDQRNYPLLIHCNHGRHRTGCVVGIVRKLSGWSLESVLNEYKTYASPKIRDCDIDYIRSFQSALLPTSAWESRRCPAVQTRTFFRTLIFSTFVVVLWYVSGSTMLPAVQDATT